MADSLEIHPSISSVSIPNLVVLDQTVYQRSYGNLPEKFDSSRPAFQSHPRSLEPTRIDQPFMTSYGLISYRFREKRRFRSKIAKFSHFRVPNAPLKWVLTGICNGGGLKKTRMMPLRHSQKVWRYVHSFRYI